MKTPDDQQRVLAAQLGIPFWREAAPYKGLVKPGSGRYAKWAWQFFRRNTEYRTFHKEKILPYLPDDLHMCPWLDDLRRDFKVLRAADPRRMDSDCVLMEVVTVSEYRPAIKGDISAYEPDPLQKLYVVDLRRSIDDQLSSIRWHALNLKRLNRTVLGDDAKERRHAIKKYINYLRVLDGLDVGARPTDIAKVLCPDHVKGDAGAQQVINDWKNAANALRERGYVDLYLSQANLKTKTSKKDGK